MLGVCWYFIALPAGTMAGREALRSWPARTARAYAPSTMGPEPTRIVGLGCGVVGAVVAGAAGQALAGAGAPAVADAYAFAGLATWAAAIAGLAVVDWRTMTIPSREFWVLGAASAMFLDAAATAGRNLAVVVNGSVCAVVVCATLSGLLLVSPQALGLGDVRLASLVAIGAGAFNPGRTVVAIVLCLLVAGSVSLWKSRRKGVPVPVAFGPFLALGGMTVVIANVVQH